MTSLPGNRPVRSSEACGTDLHVPQRCGGPPPSVSSGGPPFHVLCIWRASGFACHRRPDGCEAPLRCGCDDGGHPLGLLAGHACVFGKTSSQILRPFENSVVCLLIERKCPF